MVGGAAAVHEWKIVLDLIQSKRRCTATSLQVLKVLIIRSPNAQHRLFKMLIIQSEIIYVLM